VRVSRDLPVDRWRVFVRFRGASGVYERSIGASGPIEAEQAVSIADPGVLETLGAQFDGRGPEVGDGKGEYRRLHSTGWRLLGPLGNSSRGEPDTSHVRVIEVLAPTR
jgi:hypothetical protein